MMFEHTETRRMMAETLDRYVKEQYPFRTRDAIAASAEGYSVQHWRALAELGVLGALFSEQHGGFGGSGFDIAVVFEQFGRGLVVEPLLPALIAGHAIALAGTAPQRAVLSQLIEGARSVGFAHYEPHSHYELSHIDCRAERVSGAWVLNGTKAVVLQAQAADCFVVSARTTGHPTDPAGLSLFLIPAQAPGLVLSHYRLVDGGRAAEMTLLDVRVADEALLGGNGNAFATIEKAIGCGILALCAESVGAMDAAKDATLEYLRTRVQFGAPIGRNQALQHRMADMLLEVEQARSAVVNAAAALGSDDRDARERALSAAKYTIGRVGILVAEECIQMHGAVGMTWELPLSHYAKRLVMIDHQFGDQDYHIKRFLTFTAPPHSPYRRQASFARLNPPAV